MEAQRAKCTLLEVLTARRMLCCGFIGSALMIAVLATAQFGFGQPEKNESAPANPGLKGILPDETPDSLVYEAFEPLGEEWAKWSESISTDLMQLYGEEIPDAAGQRATIESIRKKIATADAAIATPSTSRTVRDTLVTLRGRIVRRIDVAEAALDTLQADPETARERQVARAWPRLRSSLAELRRHLNEYRGGSGWLGYVKAGDVETAIQQKDAEAPALAFAAERIRNAGGLPSEEQREFLAMPAFTNFEKAITAVQSAANAPPKEVDEAKLRAELKNLVDGLERYEATSTASAGKDVRNAFDAVEKLSADNGEAISAAMRSHYFNYNFRLYVSERFLNRLVEERRTERSQVRDQVLGANVYGNQITSVRSGVNLKPSSRDARFDVTLTGHVNTSTVGVTDQANIYTAGNHYFWASKEVRFDGERFDTRGRVRVSVNANNRTTGASTRYSGWPLIGHIADNIAVGEANRRRGQSEAIARQKVVERVQPEFNREVNEQFAKANADVQEKWLKNLADAGLEPDSRTVRTTNDFLLMNSRVMRPGELAGAATNPGENPGWGLTLRIHESAMNNAFNRLELKGRTLTQDELMDEIEKSLTDVLGRDYRKNKPASDKPKPKSTDQFVLDDEDPIRFRIVAGELNLILRTGLKREGEEDIPTQIITIPLTFDVQEKNILVKRGTVGVAPKEKPESTAKQIAQAGVMRNRIQESIADDAVDNTLSFDREDGRPPVKIVITRVETRNGWITIWAR